MLDILTILAGLLVSPAQAQTCPTRPPGDSSNACASTAFVKAGGRSLPFSGVTSQWPWQLNADGTWTTKQPTFADIASGIANNAVTISGTISSNYYLHSITLTDNAAMGSNYAYPLFVSHNVGATSTGIKPGATFQLLFTVPTANSASSFYSAMSTSAVAGASDGGVLGAPRSFLYGANPASRLQSTATYWAGVIGQDSIASIATGGSAYRRVGHVSESEGYVRGLSIDAAYGILASLGNPNGAVQWTTGILFDDSQGLLPSSGGQYPIIAGGTLIQGAYSGSGVSISGGLYAGINFAMFSSAWQQAAILLPAVNTGGIWFGYNGVAGQINTNVTSSAGVLNFTTPGASTFGVWTFNSAPVLPANATALNIGASGGGGSIVSSTTTGAGALTFGNGVTTVSSGAGIAVHVDSNGLAFDYAGGSTCTATGSIQVTINGAIKRIPYC